MSQKVFFASLSTPTEKVKFLIRVAHDHYLKDQKLIIFTADLKTAEFVDQLLWKEPKEGFLPHFISQTLLDECIVITSEKSNLNGAKSAINLSNEPIDCTSLKLHQIFEIEDKSKSDKNLVFKKKLNTYHKAGYPIVALN